MTARTHLGTYLAIIRKHLILLTVSVLIVLASGVVYLTRQQPEFRASATLRIATPQRNAMTTQNLDNLFTLDQQELNAQMILLREKKEMAQEVVERLRDAAGLSRPQPDIDDDTSLRRGLWRKNPLAKGTFRDGDGYTEAGLRANVKVEPIPGTGTRAVRFTLTGRAAHSLAEACNTYAYVYKEATEGESARAFDLQAQQVLTRERETREQVGRARDELQEFKNDHPEVHIVMRENPSWVLYKGIDGEMPALEEAKKEAVRRESAYAEILSGLNIAVHEDDSGFTLSPRDAGEGPTVAERLATEEVLAALPHIQANTQVQRWWEDERDAVRRDKNLELEGYKPNDARRQQARKEIEFARRTRGGVMAGLIRADLASIRADKERHAAAVTRRDEAKEDAQQTSDLLLEFDRLETGVKRAEDDLEHAQQMAKQLTTLYLPRDEKDAGSALPGWTVEMVAPAVSAVQIAPNRPMILGLTVFAALSVALGLVFLVEYLDDTIKSREDFDRWVGLPFLGFVPHITPKDDGNPDLAADSRPGSAIAEAFRTVRTSILFSRGDKPVRSILITSAGPGEGKTTVAINLAVTLARHKAPVLLIDADLRRPRVAKAIDLENTRGLTNCLIGESTLEEAVQPTQVEGLYALTSGPIPPNPAELLHGESMQALIVEARERFDRVVVDSPPVIAVTDARVLASCLDGLYLVLSMGKTSRRLIQRALESIVSIGFEVHGAILNNLERPTGRYGYYYYRDYVYGKGYYRDKSKAAADETA